MVFVAKQMSASTRRRHALVSALYAPELRLQATWRSSAIRILEDIFSIGISRRVVLAVSLRPGPSWCNKCGDDWSPYETSARACSYRTRTAEQVRVE